MTTQKKKQFWFALVIFGLMGQVAWVMENMYFNVYIYKMFHASAGDISRMVGASAVTAALTAWLVGAFSDKVGKRKLFICGGYMAWGVSILSFCLLRLEILQQFTGSVAAAAALGVNLTILLDCVMTFFGSSANDACFNAWLTESGDESNRGAIEGINAMMPLISILVVFGGFMAFDLEKESSWMLIFLIIGCAVFIIGCAGIFLIQDTKPEKGENQHYINNILYCFRPSVLRENQLLYVVVGAFAVFGISIQIFMPYLILYYEKSLGMENYVLVMAPAIVLAAIFTAIYGKLYDQLGFRRCVYPTVTILMTGYVLLFFSTSTLWVFIGSLLMMSGYLSGMAVFGAKIREQTPENKAGMFQGLRICGQVLIPGVIGPAIGAGLLQGAPVVENSDGTTTFLPDRTIFFGAFIAAALLLLVLVGIFSMIRNGHRELQSDCENQGELPFAEYPRPQMRRDTWYNLNGQWENGITVPYPPESRLAGFRKPVKKQLLYKRTFTLPDGFVKEKLLLHFGAVDQVAKVYVNGVLVGSHEGGYLPFTCSIEEAYHSGENELVVAVTDSLDKGYPYGKQCKKRGEMWYTPVSGIWQTVWLESVPKQYIEKVRMTPDMTGIDLEIITEAEACDITISTKEKDIHKQVMAQNGTAKLRIDLVEEGVTPELWSPEHPHLYDITIETESDRVESYFALRQVSIKEIKGKKRICLNNVPIFLHGVLDQGYFCDGIYLPISEKGYETDILAMKELGFNTLRKHIKIEPEIFYYMCDKHGMLVCQDMVNSGRYSFLWDTALPTIGFYWKGDGISWTGKKRKEFFVKHMKETIAHLYNHPCIIYYTIFNEGWGQFDSDSMYEKAKQWDATRVLDTTSGWFAQMKSDVDSRHIYFRNEKLETVDKPLVLSEFGGYSRVMKEHSYSRYNQHGYGICNSAEELTERIEESYEQMVFASMEEGLCGSIYTQLSDVEDEVNGLYTYDRKYCKVEKDRMKNLSVSLYETYQKITE